MINVEEILNDPDLCSDFTILRSTGYFGAGGWTSDSTTSLAAFGAVRNASGKEIATLPEADRVEEAITIRTTTQLFLTKAADVAQTSDVIIYQGDQYRILLTKNYCEQGYWYALAGRMAGD